MHSDTTIAERSSYLGFPLLVRSGQHLRLFDNLTLHHNVHEQEDLSESGDIPKSVKSEYMIRHHPRFRLRVSGRTTKLKIASLAY